MNPDDLDELARLARDGSVEWLDMPVHHRAPFAIFGRGITVSESPRGGALIPERDWRAYLAFMRGTGLEPDQVTEDAVNAWCRGR